MGDVSEFRLGAVRRLIEQVPDATIRNLENVLAHGGRGDRSIALIHDMVNAELVERRLKSAVFYPVAPHCEPNPVLVGRLGFPREALSLAWRCAKEAEPELIERTVRQAARMKPGDETPEDYDGLCRLVAQGLHAGDPRFGRLTAALERFKPGHAVRFAECLALAPVVRSCLPKLPIWVRTLSNDYAAAIRLAFRDATSVNEDAGPAFMEMLYGHLEEPWQVLRLISLVMDQPSDRYMASSELSSFGERLLDDIDARIDSLRRFDPARGLEAGVEAAAAAHGAVVVIAEFEQWLAINRDGPWGRRLASQRRALALVAESRLREVEPAVGAALPLHHQSARAVRGIPNLARELDPAAICKAQALLGFVYDTRNSASHGGFGSMRSKVIEVLDPKIDQYAEDLLDQIHGGVADVARARAFLEVAAEFLGLIREPAAAEIVRRRGAVA